MEKKGFKYILRGPLRKGDMTHVSSSYAVQEQAGVFLSGPVAAIITTQSRDQTQITVITRRLGGAWLATKLGGKRKDGATARVLRYSFAGDAACKVHA